MSPLDADLGQTFVQAAQAVIDTLAGASKARSRITLVSPQGAGKMRVKGEAAPGARYVVEASTNLADWEMIGVATEAEAGVFEFEDHSATPASVRFYRLMSP